MNTNILYNCDCRDVLRDLPNKSVNMILTDPPYDLTELQKENFHSEFRRVCRGPIIVFCPPENQWPSPVDQYLFWAKPISTKNTSHRYSRFVEMICVYRGIKCWHPERHWSNYVNIFTDFVDDTKLHPHRKPPALISRLLLNHTDEGDLVLDPFMGSGVVIEAAMLNKRRYIGCENDYMHWHTANERG